MRARTLALAVLTALALAGCTGTGPATPIPPSSPATGAAVAGPQAPAAAWPAPADAQAAVRSAGLPMLGEEKLAVHYHAHLDVVVSGQPVPVPAGIGIDEGRHLIAPLHTHEPDGVVHIESATDVPFTLGQFFAEWGQPLRADRVGPVALGPTVVARVYRNGTAVTGDPAALRFAAHDEIVVWIGPAGQTPQVPRGYAFAPGE